MKDLNIHPTFPEIYPQLCRFRQMDHWKHDAMPCPFWRWYWNPTPGAWVQRESTRVSLCPGRWVLLSPGSPVHTGHDEPFQHFFLHFTLGNSLRARGELLVEGPLNEGDRTLLDGLLQSPGPDPSLELGLLSMVVRSLASLPASTWHPPVSDVRIRRALERIHQDDDRLLNTAVLATELGMHPKSFSRLFREQVGQSPYRYALEHRLDAAAQELHHSRKSVETIAEEWGFSDRFHLGKLLAKHRGTTPGKLRALRSN